MVHNYDLRRCRNSWGGDNWPTGHNCHFLPSSLFAEKFNDSLMRSKKLST